MLIALHIRVGLGYLLKGVRPVDVKPQHPLFYSVNKVLQSGLLWKANGTSHRNAMRYCLVYGGCFSGVWTTKSTGGDDFEFQHNVIAHCRTAWIRENGVTRQYKADDCLFAGNSAGGEVKAGLFKAGN